MANRRPAGKYRFVGQVEEINGHQVAQGGHHRFEKQADGRKVSVPVEIGEVVELTESQANAFADRFEPVEPTVLSADKEAAGNNAATESTQPPAEKATGATGTDETHGAPAEASAASFGDLALPPQAVKALAEQNLDSATIPTMTDDELLAISGIGESTVAKLREAFGGPPEEAA